LYEAQKKAKKYTKERKLPGWKEIEVGRISDLRISQRLCRRNIFNK
jgi:hypothetical protein